MKILQFEDFQQSFCFATTTSIEASGTSKSLPRREPTAGRRQKTIGHLPARVESFATYRLGQEVNQRIILFK